MHLLETHSLQKPYIHVEGGVAEKKNFQLGQIIHCKITEIVISNLSSFMCIQYSYNTKYDDCTNELM